LIMGRKVIDITGQRFGRLTVLEQVPVPPFYATRNAWWKCKCDILETYTSEMPPKIPLSKNKEFKSIKNDIIREALGLLSGENNSLFDVDSQKEQKNNRSKNSSGSAQGNHNYQPQHSKVSAVAVTRLFKNMATIMGDRIDQMNRGKNPIRLIDKRQRQEIEDKKNAELTMT